MRCVPNEIVAFPCIYIAVLEVISLKQVETPNFEAIKSLQYASSVRTGTQHEVLDIANV